MIAMRKVSTYSRLNEDTEKYFQRVHSIYDATILINAASAQIVVEADL